MNVLFICDEYPPGQTGGIGIVVQSLSRELVAQGHKVCVVGLYKIEFGGSDYEIDKGVKIWRIRYKKNWPHSVISYKIQRNLPTIIQSKTSAFKSQIELLHFVQTIIDTEEIDIIEMTDWQNSIYDTGINIPIPKLKVPLVVKLHGSMSYFNFEMNRSLRKKWLDIDKDIFNRADALSATSSYAAEINTKLFGKGKNIRILYNAIEVPTKKNDKAHREDLTVVFAGTLIEKKGIFSLMKAWNLVFEKEKAAKLLVYGKGNIESLKQILNTESKNSVIFKGHQPKEIVMESFTKATLAVFPSYSETFGLVAIEAMSVECPTIFTIKSSGKEIIENGKNGLLIDPDDIEQISESILSILHNKTFQKMLGENGRDEVESRFNIIYSAKEHIAFYNETIKDFKYNINND